MTTYTRREELLSLISDMHKDAYGFRPRGYNWSSYNNDDLETQLDSYEKIIQENTNNEALHNTTKVEEFKLLLQNTINNGTGDRHTALRWLFQGSELSIYEYERFIYNQGIAYTPYGDTITTELLTIIQQLAA